MALLRGTHERRLDAECELSSEGPLDLETRQLFMNINVRCNMYTPEDQKSCTAFVRNAMGSEAWGPQGNQGRARPQHRQQFLLLPICETALQNAAQLRPPHLSM